jgi:hypothetical protein
MSATSVRAGLYRMGISPDKLKTVAPQTAPVAVVNIATADATDLATALTLANATKAKVNELLTNLRGRGIIG